MVPCWVVLGSRPIACSAPPDIRLPKAPVICCWGTNPETSWFRNRGCPNGVSCSRIESTPIPRRSKPNEIPRFAASVPNPTAVPAADPATSPPTGPAAPNDPAIAAPDAAVAAAEAAWSMMPLMNSPPISINDEMVDPPTGEVFPAAAGIAPAVRMSSSFLTAPPLAAWRALRNEYTPDWPPIASTSAAVKTCSPSDSMAGIMSDLGPPGPEMPPPAALPGLPL